MDISPRFEQDMCDGYGQFGPNVFVYDHARVINGKRYDFTQILYPDGARVYMVFDGYEAVKGFKA